MNAGIDYSMGTANRNADTNIHYGVISTHSLSSWVWEDARPIYPDTIEAECESCHTLFDTDEQETAVCSNCEAETDVSGTWDYVDPVSWDYTPNDREYTTEYSETLNCVFVTQSPYYTYTHYCSPCVPGAGDLDTPDEDGVKTFCFSHDMFEDNHAPYPVYRVSDETLVEP